MPIDNCQHSFKQLADLVLPEHFARLGGAIKTPLPAETFVGYKTATKPLLAKLGKAADFPGCYVFLDGRKPIYVGISRNLVKRLVQHLNFDSHYSASLVYRMASDEFPHEMKRDQAMKDEQFKATFFSAQSRLRKMSVAFVNVSNDLELYMLEVLAAMELNTDTWNTFRTH
jgi:hypothetical protein